MAIQFNKVTWYSKVLALIVFLAALAFAFYMGMQYGTIRALIRYSPAPVPTPTFTPMPSSSSAAQAEDSSPLSSPSSAQQGPVEKDVTLSVGQAISAEGLTITLNKIANDSRCPSGVQCIWAGNVTANVTLVTSVKSENKDMASGDAPYKFGNYRISITNVDPYPAAKQQIRQDEYRVTFRIIAL